MFFAVVAFAISSVYANAVLEPLPPTRLLVEYAASPAIVDMQAPRFSWHTAVANTTGGRRVVQTAFRLQVCEVPLHRSLPWRSITWECDTECAEGSCVWDSGRVDSNKSWNVRFGSVTGVSGSSATLLTSDATYAWRVMWWAAHADKPDGSSFASAFSEVAVIYTGLIDGAQALPDAAAWIGASLEEFEASRLGTTQLRTEFSLPTEATVTRASAFVASPGYYTLAVDGRLSSDAVLGPFTVFTRRLLYDVLDVTSLFNRRPAPEHEPTHDGGGSLSVHVEPDERIHSSAMASHSMTTPRTIPTQRHALAVTLANGWYSQPTVALGPRMMSLRLNIAYVLPNKSRGTVVVVSNSSWYATNGPTTLADIYLGAVHDASLETIGWELPGYNTPVGRWSPATELVSPLLPTVGVLRAQVMPPIRRVESFKPVTTTYFTATASAEAMWVIDFGQNMAGTVCLSIPAAVIAAAPSGSNITVRHAEAVYPNGSLHHLYGDRVAETVTYTISPSTTQSDVVYEPAHTYFGFRYVAISGEALTHFVHHSRSVNSSHAMDRVVSGREADVPALPVSVVAHFVHSDLQRTGSITTSSDLLNRIIHAATYSQLGTWTSIPTGCTQRERRGWLGDAQLASEGQLHTVFAAPAYGKFLDDITDTQADEWEEHNGSIPEVCPNYGHGAVPPDPPFGVGFAVIWWNHYRYNGDMEALAKHYDGVKAFADTLVMRAGGAGTFAGVLGLNTSTHGDWVSVANQSAEATTCSGRAALDHHANATCCLFMECPDAVVNGFYYVMQFRILAAAARALGLVGDAARYGSLAQSATSLLAAASFRQGKMGYGYQTDQALALALGGPGGVVPPDEVAAVAAALAGDVASRGGHLNTGIFGTKVLLPALSSNGYADSAIDVLTQTTGPGWGAWVAKYNATTLFEMWGAYDGDPPSTGTASRNHVMFSSFMPWLYQVVAGIAMDDHDYGTSVLPPPHYSLSARPHLSPDIDGVTESTESTPITAFESFRIAPRLVGGLSSVSASMLTMRGQITVAIRWSSDAVSLNVSIPVGADTRVTTPLPRGRCGPSTAVVHDETTRALVWQRGTYVPGVDGVVSAVAASPNVRGGAGVVITVGSGSYQFLASCL